MRDILFILVILVLTLLIGCKEYNNRYLSCGLMGTCSLQDSEDQALQANRVEGRAEAELEGDNGAVEEAVEWVNAKLGTSYKVDNISTITKLDFTDKLTNTDLDNLGKHIVVFTELSRLMLSGNNLTLVPDSIGDLTKLEELSLANNSLGSLPASIGNLKKLTTLSLANNSLTSVPEGIFKLTGLIVLSLHDNQITKLPSGIGNLKELEELSLASNRLTLLPDRIGDLTKLKDLILNNNQIIKLPDRVGDLTKLQLLNLSNNQIEKLPDDIGNLKELEELYLVNNEGLASLPSSIKRSNLKKIYLGGTKLSQEKTKEAIEDLLPTNCEIVGPPSS